MDTAEHGYRTTKTKIVITVSSPSSSSATSRSADHMLTFYPCSSVSIRGFIQSVFSISDGNFWFKKSCRMSVAARESMMPLARTSRRFDFAIVDSAS